MLVDPDKMGIRGHTGLNSHFLKSGSSSSSKFFSKKSKKSLTPDDSSIVFSIPTATKVAESGMFFTGLPLESEQIRGGAVDPTEP